MSKCLKFCPGIEILNRFSLKNERLETLTWEVQPPRAPTPGNSNPGPTVNIRRRQKELNMYSTIHTKSPIQPFATTFRLFIPWTYSNWLASLISQEMPLDVSYAYYALEFN